MQPNSVSHLPVFVADQQNQLLSNELFVTLPLDTEDIMLPTEAYQSQRKGDEAEDEGDTKKALLPADETLDDMYKEVLKIQPGSPHDGTCPFFTPRVIANTNITDTALSFVYHCNRFNILIAGLYNKQVAQLSQRDRAAGWVSYG